MVDTHQLDEVVDVPDDLGDRRLRHLVPVLAQEGDGEVDADDPAGVGDRPQLLVCQIAGGSAQCMRVRVRRHQRRVGQLGDLPESRPVEMRQVDQDSELVARAHELAAGRGQTTTRVG